MEIYEEQVREFDLTDLAKGISELTNILKRSNKRALMEARVEGKTWDEIQPEIIKMIYYYSNLYYNKNKNIYKMYKVERDDIVDILFKTLFSKGRGNKNYYSNLESKFIEASDKGYSMKFISNNIGRATQLNCMSYITKELQVRCQPNMMSLDQTCEYLSEGQMTYADIITDDKTIEEETTLSLFLHEMPLMRYSRYFIVDNDLNTKELTNREMLINLYNGHTASSLRNRIFSNNDLKPIKYEVLVDIIESTRNSAKSIIEKGDVCLHGNVR